MPWWAGSLAIGLVGAVIGGLLSLLGSGWASHSAAQTAKKDRDAADARIETLVKTHQRNAFVALRVQELLTRRELLREAYHGAMLLADRFDQAASKAVADLNASSPGYSIGNPIQRAQEADAECMGLADSLSGLSASQGGAHLLQVKLAYESLVDEWRLNNTSGTLPSFVDRANDLAEQILSWKQELARSRANDMKRLDSEIADHQRVLGVDFDHELSHPSLPSGK